jgi:hypothetical protein
MTTRQVVSQILERLPEHRLQQLLDYALYLQEQDEKAEWQCFGQQQLCTSIRR